MFDLLPARERAGALLVAPTAGRDATPPGALWAMRHYRQRFVVPAFPSIGLNTLLSANLGTSCRVRSPKERRRGHEQTGCPFPRDCAAPADGACRGCEPGRRARAAAAAGAELGIGRGRAGDVRGRGGALQGLGDE